MLSDWLVTIWKPEYASAIPVMQVFGIYAILQSIAILPGNILILKNKQQHMPLMMIAQIVVNFVLLWPFAANWGIMGVGWTRTIAVVVSLLWGLIVAGSAIGMKIGDLVGSLWDKLVAGIGMAGILILIKRYFMPDWFHLIAAVIIAIVIYLILLLIIQKKSLVELMDLLSMIIKRKKNAQ